MQQYLNIIDEVIARGPYKDNWESLSQYRVPGWYKDIKFGIFIHWGLFSVPAFGNEWYPRNMYVPGSPEYEHHKTTYGPQSKFGLKDFVPLFKAENWNPDEWAKLFKEAGAQYVVPVAEHHDGFQMYKSDISHWNAYEMGPHRDVLGELQLSCKAQGMLPGVSSHRIEHWFFLGMGRTFDSDIKEPIKRGDLYWPSVTQFDHQDLYSDPQPSKEFLDDWLVRTCEIIDRYRPKILYFDWWIQVAAAKPYLKKLAAYYYNRAAEWGEEVVINYKHDAFFFGTAVPDVERGQFADIKPYDWQTDTAVALNSWGYTTNNKYRPANEILQDLCDIVSKNGRLLLNIGPRADGIIPQEDANILRVIGAWMKINGEAIYSARTWRKYGEGPTQITDGGFSDGIKKNFTSADFRFTTRGDKLYAIALKGSGDGSYVIQSLGELDALRVANFHGIIKSVEALDSEKPVHWTRDGEGLKIRSDRTGDMPVVFKISID